MNQKTSKLVARIVIGVLVVTMLAGLVLPIFA